MLRYIFSLVFLLSLIACKNDKPTTPPAATPPPPAPAAVHQVNLPSITLAEMENLNVNCDFIDYTFYDPRLPMSISLDELSSIRQTLGHVSQAPPAPTAANCKPSGRIFYQSKGEYILEAEFYFTDGCAFFVFFKDGKATYANDMADAGKQFFSNNIAQALKAVGAGAPSQQ